MREPKYRLYIYRKYVNGSDVHTVLRSKAVSKTEANRTGKRICQMLRELNDSDIPVKFWHKEVKDNEARDVRQDPFDKGTSRKNNSNI